MPKEKPPTKKDITPGSSNHKMTQTLLRAENQATQVEWLAATWANNVLTKYSSFNDFMDKNKAGKRKVTMPIDRLTIEPLSALCELASNPPKAAAAVFHYVIGMGLSAIQQQLNDEDSQLNSFYTDFSERLGQLLVNENDSDIPSEES